MTQKQIKNLEKQLADARQTIADLRNRVKSLKNVTDHLYDGIMISNSAGKLIFVNSKACDLTGYTKQELVSVGLEGLFAPGALEIMAAGSSDKQALVDEPHQTFPTALRCINGRTLTVMLSQFKIAWDSQPAEMLLFIDLSEFVHTGKGPIISRTAMASLLETTKDLIAVVDAQSNLLFANGAIRRFFSQLFGQKLTPNVRLFDLHPPERVEFWRGVFKKTFASGWQKFDQQYIVQNQRYDIEWFSSRVLKDDGSTLGISIVGRDITSRRMAEEALRERNAQLHHAQKMEAVGTLAGGVAHEFNNVLSIVLGNIELAAMDMFNDHPLRTYMDEAKNGVLRAKKVVRQLLDFSRKSEGQQLYVELHTIVSNAMKLLRSSIPSHIEFHQLIDQCPPILADPVHIHQVIINVCTNAAEAMDEDGGVLTVTLEHITFRQNKVPAGLTLGPGKYAKLTVSDNGCGMEKEDLERVFEPFFTTKESNQSSGLGLSVVHGIVKRHAGEIAVQSKPGKGSTFVIYLPTIEQSIRKSITIDPESLMGEERILFVDDEPKVVVIIERMLKALGYHVEAFTNPKMAIHRFEEGPDDFDVVISDIAMPKMTGEKLIKQVRLIRPDIPAILVTGYSEKIDEYSAAALECLFAIKPLTQLELGGLVRKAIDQKIPMPPIDR
ncbi:MAG: ATP-binding protein [Desulfobacteraceae bacterium]|jgi:PAS domain S-box-containing protein